MKHIILLSVIILLNIFDGFSQASGNANYYDYMSSNENVNQVKNTLTNKNSFDYAEFKIRGLYNAEPSQMVAYFSVIQTGKSAEEATALIDARINAIKAAVNQQTEVFADMVGFIPVYEYENDKKIFSKKTYLETPVGFRISKTLHVAYNKADELDEIIAICAKNEVYDLIRVEYLSADFEQILDSLKQKAYQKLSEKTTQYAKITGVDLSQKRKALNDGFTIYTPDKRYFGYEPFSDTEEFNKRSITVKKSGKTVTMYYQPISQTDFDFVINPENIEPVNQIIYELELKIEITPRKEAKEPDDNFYILTPAGELKRIKF